MSAVQIIIPVKLSITFFRLNNRNPLETTLTINPKTIEKNVMLY